MSSTRRGLPLTSSSIEKIFPKLTPAQLSRIAARGHIRSMEDGEVLYEQGYSAPPFFVVVSGELEVVRPSVPVETLVTTYELTVNRNGQIMDLTITLQARPNTISH